MATQLTTAQLSTLKASLAGNSNTVLINGVATPISAVPVSPDNAQVVANWYNLTASPAFWAWHTTCSLSAAGQAVKMSDVGNLTTANSTRLQVSFQIRPNGFNPGNQDDRSLFGSLFSVAGASGTRSGLLAIWQKTVTNAEKLYATGTGTQCTGDLNTDGSVTVGSPATLGFEGSLQAGDILAAWAS